MAIPTVENFDPAALGFMRAAVVVPEVRVADVEFNTRAIVEALAEAAARGCRLAVFPELGVTAYTCADLFYQQTLLTAARDALSHIAKATARHRIAAVVGLPLAIGGRLFNCAAFVSGGRVLGVVPKTYLPITNEYYEDRWFATANEAPVNTIELDGAPVPFGADLLFDASNMPGCTIGIEICEDVWSVNPPSGEMAIAGATVLLNPSASDEVLGKSGYRNDLVKQQSARCLAAYLYAGSGPGESTTDVVFGGDSLIAENGTVLARTERFRFARQMAVADLDVQLLMEERLKNTSFSATRATRVFRRVAFALPVPGEAPAFPLIRPQLTARPFVPTDPGRRAATSEEVFSIQATGLAKRLAHTQLRRVTLGLSGGLDSTLALLVIIRAFDVLGLPHEGIVAATMPGFGTTSRTRQNAMRLAELLGITLREIPIGEAVTRHLRDIGHPEGVFDVTYENAQARERTQILMDLANQVGGLVVGTGDLSELALGWATYNADHMSMYHVNAGVPKTLVRYVVEWCAESLFGGETAAVLHDIVATPITPELLPLGGEARDILAQETEATIGPYALHDFFLFYAVRHAFSPRKIFVLARQAFDGVYGPEEIVSWMRVFYQRFFAMQFKRSAMPDGPKVGSVALSPRGDWRMPSDASAALWLREVDELAASARSDAKADGAANGANGRKGRRAAAPPERERTKA